MPRLPIDAEAWRAPRPSFAARSTSLLAPTSSVTDSPPRAPDRRGTEGAGRSRDPRRIRHRRAGLSITTGRGRAVLLLAPLLLFAVLAWSRRWTSEDAFIYYRIVENLLDGGGPVFNLGERVEAYTGPLWLGLLALGRALVPDGVHLEWIAVGLGLALSVAGLAAAGLAALRVWSRPPPDGGAQESPIALPLGGLVVAALPAFWDYATSGLETGLVFGWLGGVYLGLVALELGRRPERAEPASAAPSGEEREGRTGRRGWAALAVAIGLGPLVRPDLAVFSLAFLVLLITLDRPRSVRRAAGLVALAAAIPLAYQVFRMGYFGSLVPNTALAKEAGATAWGRGFEYLADLLSAYALWIPLAALLAWAALAAREAWRREEDTRALLAAVPIAAGLVHVLYVVRLGGDYMHARMLLPSVFALLLPVAVVAPRRRAAAILAAVVVPWAIVCAFALRAPADLPSDPDQLQVNDQRRRYAETWGYRNPVTLASLVAQPDRRPALQRRQGLDLARLAERRRAVVLAYTSDRNRFGERARRPIPLEGVEPRPGLEPRVVALSGNVGRTGWAAGPLVQLVDRNGLADPIGARLRLPRERRARPGHEKTLRAEWVLARFAAPTSPAGARSLDSDPKVRAARQALGCPPLRELLEATSAPLGPERFLANVGYAIRERSLRFASDPRLAARELCRRP